MANDAAYPAAPRFMHAVEALGDVICEGETLPKSLLNGLKYFLDVLGRSGGALYLPVSASLPSLLWIKFAVPAQWEQQLDSYSSPIRSLVQNVVTSGKALPGNEASDLGAILPIQFRNLTMGALLVNGPTATAEEIPDWQSLARPFGRSVYSFTSCSRASSTGREIAAWQIVADIQKAASIQETELNIVRGIKEYFQAEAAILILLDEEIPELAIKKQLGDGAEWFSQISLKLENGLVQQCIDQGKPIQVNDIEASNSVNPDFDLAEGMDIQSIICVPLVADGKTLGVLELFNKPKSSLEGFEFDFLIAISSALANAMDTSKQIQRLKVTNADLEASRWELLRSRNTLRILFDNIPSSLYIIDRSYNLVAINLARCERAGSKPSSLVGKKCYDKLYQRNDPCPGCRVNETLMTGQRTRRLSRQWIDKDQLREWEISTFVIPDEQGKCSQAILLEEDVTERRHLETDLIQSEKLAAVGQLAAGVAHEINNPLSAIIANAQILQRELPAENEDVQESLKLIELAGVRASQVVRNLLGFARKEQYEFHLVDLNETIQNALSLLQHEFLAHPVTLNFNQANELPPIIASKDHLQGVWINLVINAIDAIDKEQGIITITSRFVDNEFRISVADNGKGIPPDRLNRIFEPFFTTKAPGRGTGLGLSVSFRIIKQHGGTIQVESVVGQGSVFTVVLPATPERAITEGRNLDL
jgi:two-component system, NtrC family, sensor kinase